MKYKIYAIFLALSLVLMANIVRNFSVESNIYSLLNLPNDEAQITQNLRESLANEIVFLSDNAEVLRYLKAQNSDIFKRFNLNAMQYEADLGDSADSSDSADFSRVDSSDSIDSSDSNRADSSDSMGVDSGDSAKRFLALMDSYKLATLDFHAYSEILQNDDFVKNAINNIFSPITARILPINSDFLNLAIDSSLLKNASVDFESGLIYTTHNNVKYYIAQGILSDKISSSDLLAFIAEAKSYAKDNAAILLTSGGAIFSAVGEERGNFEGLYMSVISLVLIGALLYSAASSVHIFKLIFIVIFGFLCGMAGSFAIFDTIQILSIVISTSLIGLVLDFSMHFLSLNYKRHLPISRLKKVLISGLLVAISGYAVFLLSQMQLLAQIAIIAIFTLIGAFVATYFLLPQMIASPLKPSRIFRLCLIKYILFLKKSSKIWLIAPILLVMISIPFFAKSDFSDNINDYYAPPKSLIEEAIEINKILQNTSTVQFIVIESLDSNDLIAKERSLGAILQERGLIEAYSGISSVFLSPKEQNLAKIKLLDSIHKNESFLLDLGFSKSDIYSFIRQVESLKIIDFNENLYNIFDIFKLHRFIVQDKSDFADDSANEVDLGDSTDSSDFTEGDSAEGDSIEFKRADFSDSAISSEFPLKSIMFLKNPKIATIDSEINAILSAHNAKFIDFNASINSGFEAIKINAIMLKIGAFVVAFVILSLCFGVRLGAFMTLNVVFATILSLCVMVVCGVKINIFSIFGLILASVVGIDYMIFALHKQKIPAILGIILASLTSIISFGIVATSHFGALSAFGFASALGMFFCAILASLFAVKRRLS